MNLNEYQSAALATAIHPHGTILAKTYGFDGLSSGPTSPLMQEIPIGLIYAALGLGEVGELQGKIKKLIRDKGGVLSVNDARDISLELGDILWYVADVASELGMTLETVAQQNLTKLADRQAKGSLQGSGDHR